MNTLLHSQTCGLAGMIMHCLCNRNNEVQRSSAKRARHAFQGCDVRLLQPPDRGREAAQPASPCLAWANAVVAVRPIPCPHPSASKLRSAQENAQT